MHAQSSYLDHTTTADRAIVAEVLVQQQPSQNVQRSKEVALTAVEERSAYITFEDSAKTLHIKMETHQGVHSHMG